jgi:hypothetical protein
MNSHFEDKYVLVRANESGVWFGLLKEWSSSILYLKEARRIWYWEGANECVDLSQNGIDKKKSKVSPLVDDVIVVNYCELLLLSEKARGVLYECKEWSYSGE